MRFSIIFDHSVKGRPCGSVAQLAECSNGKREALRSSPFCLPFEIGWLSLGSRLGQRASKSACVVGPPLFRADSGTNLIEQGRMSKDDHVAR